MGGQDDRTRRLRAAPLRNQDSSPATNAGGPPASMDGLGRTRGQPRALGAHHARTERCRTKPLTPPRPGAPPTGGLFSSRARPAVQGAESFFFFFWLGEIVAQPDDHASSGRAPKSRAGVDDDHHAARRRRSSIALPAARGQPPRPRSTTPRPHPPPRAGHVVRRLSRPLLRQVPTCGTRARGSEPPTAQA